MLIESPIRLHESRLLRASRRKPLATCMGAIFALAAPATYANTFVTNCNDTGAGSLRNAVTVAVEGDTVDASGLTTSSPGCATSTISLTTGAIVTSRNDLTIKGPGLTALNVTGKYNNTIQHSRIFTHNGTGTLRIQDLSMSKGYAVNAAGVAKGGCIYSKGSVLLLNAGVTGCTAKGTVADARGGGIYTIGQTTLVDSTISLNTADSSNGPGALGGAVYALGNFRSTRSNIINNIATNTGNNGGYEGAVMVKGLSVGIYNSTIAGNHADGNVGGLGLINGSGSLAIVNSTISGNSAKKNIGGIYSQKLHAYFFNSTIAFNTAGGPAGFAAGVVLSGPVGATAKFESILIANNSFGSPAVPSDINGNVAVSGSNNLVLTPGISLPADTIVGKCPLLGPLKDNGGASMTHALLGHSPAIDKGNNKFGDSSDQRGSLYARESGSPGGPAIADIGAYEVDRADKVFDVDFEGCS